MGADGRHPSLHKTNPSKGFWTFLGSISQKRIFMGNHPQVYNASSRDVLGCTSPPTSIFPEAQEMSRGRSPWDISRAEGNLEVGGDIQPNTSRFEAVYGHSLIINPSLGMYQEIHPCRASSTYSVKINTSLPMMRECDIHPYREMSMVRALNLRHTAL